MRLLAAALLLIATAAHATPTDFQFKDVEFQNICATIGVLGKFNVIVDPALGRMKLTVGLKQVEPLDALSDVAHQAGATVQRVRHEEGTVTATYMVGRAEDMPKQSAYGRTVQLKYAFASQIAKTAGERLEALTGNKLSVDERTNRLLLTGTDEGLSRAMDVIRDLDLPVPTADVTFTLGAGPSANVATVWNGTASAAQGKVARINLGVAGALKAPSWKLVQIEGKVQVRVNADNFLGVGLNVAATLEKDGVRHAVHWATEVQAQDATTVLVGTVEVGNGEVITLSVKPVVQKGTAIGPVAPTAGPGGGPVPAASPGSGDLDLEGI